MARKPVFPVADKKYGDEVKPDDTPIDKVLEDMMPPEPEPTLEDLGLNLNPDRPTVHAHVVFEEHEPPLIVPMDQPGSQFAATPPEQHLIPKPSAPSAPLQFHSRITVTDAYQFDGRTAKAPPFINRDWITVIDGKPALRDESIGEVRMGDWVVKQDILGDNGEVEQDRIVALSNADFQKYFVRKS